MLMAIVTALFLVGKADVAKLAAVSKARQQNWIGRTTAPTGPDMLRPWHDPQGSEFPAAAQALQSVPISAGPLFSGQTQTLQGQSANTIIANTWANTPGAPGIPFPPMQYKNMVPHTDALGLIGKQDVTQGIFKGFQALFDPGMDSGGNLGFQAARKLGTSSVPLLPGSNNSVQAAGAAMEYPVGAAINAVLSSLQDVLDFVNGITFGIVGASDAGKKVQSVLDRVKTFANFFHNLYEASQGKPGDDPYSNN
jgi:hypothetical protein